MRQAAARSEGRVPLNQRRRRRTIQARARKLLAEVGYEGVTMRGLASDCGVGLVTLYRDYSDKNDLLRHAVRERYEQIFQEIDRDESEGLDRIFLIIDFAIGQLFKDQSFFRASLLGSPLDLYGIEFKEYRGQIYREALEQIAAAGDLRPWVNTQVYGDFLARQLRSGVLDWVAQLLSDDKLIPDLKLTVCAVLDGLTIGKTNERLTALTRELSRQLAED